jgi:hypothetical protein
MVAGMNPVLRPGVWAFCTLPGDRVSAEALADSLATFREDEGLALILPLEAAQRLDLDTTQPMARIVLEVFSALDGVGLTAAVATALADHGIPCNMIAAYHHDNVFVPLARADEALAILQQLQQSVSATGDPASQS